MDCSLPGSSVHGILQARILEWVAVPSSRGSFPTRGIELSLLCLPVLAGGFFTTNATWEAPNIVYFHLSEIPGIGKFVETESRKEITKG